MNNWRKELHKHRLIKTLSSIRITVTCLALLFILTFWGTVAQIDQGLYAAQERFFFSWFFLAGGFFPFPGAKLVLWIFFINLVCVSLVRFVFDRRHLGITIIHMGLLSYFVAAFVTFYVTVESHVTLLEGAGTNVSQAYRDWELSVWEGDDQKRNVTAVDASSFAPGKTFQVNDLSIEVENYYHNAKAYTSPSDSTEAVNQSGIKSLAKIPSDKESEKNVPGGIFTISGKSVSVHVLLFGGEATAQPLKIDGKTIHVQLRHKNFQLPFLVKLKSFEMDMHPGTQIAKSYRSMVTFEHDGLTREVTIWMNHPLRFKEYTLYQASYSIDQWGREHSTLAVVKNAGRLMPYVASFITFSGLVTHFLLMGLSSRKKHV